MAGPPHPSRRALHLGVAGWIVATLLTWPSALTFFDETGYLGQARLLLEGRLLPQPESVGIWIPAEPGPIPKYPAALPILLAPLFALHPRAVFVLGVAAAVATTYAAASILERWGRAPAWALVVLAYPPLVLASRTAMPDVPLCALALGTAIAIERRRPGATAALAAATVWIKPTGIPLLVALIAAEAFRARRATPTAVAAVAGGALGALAVVALNFAAGAGPGYAYSLAHARYDVFSLRHLATSGVAHLITLFAVPPLLIRGAWSWWRRREHGPWIAAFAMTALSMGYWFVDAGRNPVESLVLAPRLILPAVVFLLVGWIDRVAGLAARVGRERAVAAVLVVAAIGVATAVGLAHRRLLAPAATARRIAERLIEERGYAGPLGLTLGAFKAGLLSPRSLHWVNDATGAPPFVLCNRAGYSHRDPGARSCSRDGYVELERSGSFSILARGAPGAPPRP